MISATSSYLILLVGSVHNAKKKKKKDDNDNISTLKLCKGIKNYTVEGKTSQL